MTYIKKDVEIECSCGHTMRCDVEFKHKPTSEDGHIKVGRLCEACRIKQKEEWKGNK